MRGHAELALEDLAGRVDRQMVLSDQPSPSDAEVDPDSGGRLLLADYLPPVYSVEVGLAAER
ncbi:MAG: hypothetical protein A2Z37_08240 [Chloroflexi bacterium RBG_19FT_COMBO_62_14]|nr:MAG: hypothetical protein A2Z37_08240 [Chloroflexi bacterium RBG_19FT_COMBO_62_14]